LTRHHGRDRRRGWIDAAQFETLGSRLAKSDHGQYLPRMAADIASARAEQLRI
jgi:hypothetical protein